MGAAGSGEEQMVIWVGIGLPDLESGATTASSGCCAMLLRASKTGLADWGELSRLLDPASAASQRYDMQIYPRNFRVCLSC